MKLKNSDLVKPGQLRSAPHERGDWYVTVPNNTTLDMIKAPGLWAHHANTLKPGARIEVVREDFSLDVELRVIKSEAGLVYVRVVREYVDDSDITAAAAASGASGTEELKIPEGYKIGFAPRGDNRGHFVHHQATGVALIRKLNTRREAIAFARKHFTESNPGADPDAEDDGAVVKAA